MLFSFSFKPYIAVIGDIKQSKKIPDRKCVQEKLNTILNRINETYMEDISAKFVITLGDEFQGLLCNGENLLYIIEEIQQEMHPIRLRFGIGIGEITTDINTEMAIGADGPGYYKARRAIEELKQKEQKNKIQSADIRIEIEEDKNSVAIMINTIFLLTTVIKNGWSDRQREIIVQFQKDGKSQLECAKKLGISQSSVQRGLNNGNYYAYKDAICTVNNILREINDKHV